MRIHLHFDGSQGKLRMPGNVAGFGSAEFGVLTAKVLERESCTAFLPIFQGFVIHSSKQMTR